MSLSKKIEFGNTVGLLQLEQAKALLIKETRMPWIIEEKELKVYVLIQASARQEIDKIFREKMRSVMEGMKLETYADTKGAAGFIKDPRTIVRLAEKFSGVYRPQLSVTEKVREEELRSAVAYLKRETFDWRKNKGYDWELKDAEYVKALSSFFSNAKGSVVFCEVFVEGKEREAAEREFDKRIKDTTGLSTEEVRTHACARAVPGGVKVWAWTPSPMVVKNLALLNTAPETLRLGTDSGNPMRFLAERISDVIKTYSEEECVQPLPRPLVALTREGLVIKLPKEFVEGSNEKNVEAIAQQKPRRINEKVEGRTFVAQVTIPFTQVLGFLIDGLILKGDIFALSNFIDEMIREHQEDSRLLTEDQIKQLRGGR